MNWKNSIIITIIIMIPFSIFIFWYQDTYRNATIEFQNLYFAIVAGIAGILLHFLKNHESVKNKKPNLMTVESLELLLLVITPTATSFSILKTQFPETIIPILVVFGLAISSWYFITLFRVTRKEDETDGKPIFFLSTYLFISFISIILLGAVLSML